MFRRLQQKWGVTPLRLVLILCTFAIGGSLCSWAGRKLMVLSGLDKGVLWWVLYLVLITLLWPLAVLLVSALFGQFAFFKNYLGRVARRMGFGKKMAVRGKPSEQKQTLPNDAG